MTSHFVEILTALALTTVLSGSAAARLYPPKTDCTRLMGNARIACNRQMGNIQRGGTKGSATPLPSPTSSSAGEAGGRQAPAPHGRHH